METFSFSRRNHSSSLGILFMFKQIINYEWLCFRTPCKNSKVRQKQKLMARKWKTINYSSSWRSFTHICSLVAACHYFCSATQEKSSIVQTLIFPTKCTCSLYPCISKHKCQKTKGDNRLRSSNTCAFLSFLDMLTV